MSAVPIDDLPANLVPPNDMPAPQGAQPAAPAAPRAAAKDPSMMQKMQSYSRLGPLGLAAGMGMAISDEIPHIADRAGGKIAEELSKKNSPEVAAAMGVIGRVGIEAVPAVLGGEVAKLGSPAMVSKAKGLMSSALKPSKAALKSGDAGRAVDTMLERGVNVTEGGVEKLTKQIDHLDDQLERVISQSKAQVDKIEVLKPIKEALARFRKEASTTDNLQKIREAAKEFFNHPSLRGKSSMPIQQAQEMKRANYRALGDKAYGAGLKPEAEREGIKAVTRGLKEGVEKAAPEAGAINAEMSELINARNIAQDRVLMSGNKNPIGMGILNPKMLVPWLADRSELAKSLAARGMYSGSRVIPQTAGNVVGAAGGMALGIPAPAPYVPQPPPQDKSR